MDSKDETSQESPTPSCGNWDTNDPDQQEVSRILTSLKQDLLGVISLGKDGIMRSLTADRKVLSAEPMSNKLVRKFLSRMPEDFHYGLETADGTKTPREKWFKPDDDILPTPMSEENLEKSRKMVYEKREWWIEKMKNEPHLVDVSGVLEAKDEEEKTGD